MRVGGQGIVGMEKKQYLCRRNSKEAKGSVSVAYPLRRVRQGDCKDDTALLNRRRNSCLRSPQKIPFSGDPKTNVFINLNPRPARDHKERRKSNGKIYSHGLTEVPPR